MIDHIRPYIIQENIPSDTLVNALRANAAKRFRVKKCDLLSLPSLIAEIAAEIVDCSYLQETERMQYLEAIDAYLLKNPEPDNEQKDFIRQMLSVSLIISFLISSLFLVIIIEGMKKVPEYFNEIFCEWPQNLVKQRISPHFLTTGTPNYYEFTTKE